MSSGKPTTPLSDTPHSPDDKVAPVPANTFWSYAKSFGPGIVVALTWIGTADLIENSVAGANYGYSLIWVLPLTLIFRFVFVNNLGKYPLYNVQRDSSIVRGFSRTHPIFGWLILISFFLYTHILLAFTMSGIGTALHGLFGGLPSFWWSVIGAASVLVVTVKGLYIVLERIFKIVMAVMVLSFIVAVALVGISWGDLFHGFALEIPSQMGVFNATVIASSLVLATLGSMTNLFYPQILREKGWTTPGHRRIQQFDLLFGTLMVLLLGVAIWVIGAEVLHSQGKTVENASDIANALGQVIGPIGPIIFYSGLFCAAWTTVSGALFALSKMSVESLHFVWPKRAKKFAGMKESKDPFYKIMIVWGLAAVLWSLPQAPGFVVLVVVSHIITAPFLLVIVIGLIAMMNKKAIMGTHTNSIWENIGLTVVGIAIAVSAYQSFADAIDLLTS